jgi:hypothetical protein
VTSALDIVAAAGCPQHPILVLQPSAVGSRQSADSPRFIMGRKLQGGGSPGCAGYKVLIQPHQRSGA